MNNKVTKVLDKDGLTTDCIDYEVHPYGSKTFQFPVLE